MIKCNLDLSQNPKKVAPNHVDRISICDPNSVLLTSDMFRAARAQRILCTLKELSTVHATNTKLPRLRIQILAWRSMVKQLQW